MNKWGMENVSIGQQPERMHGPDYADKISEAIAAKLEECAKRGQSRSDIAHRMSRIMGTTIRENILNQYSSTAAQDKNISVARFLAFMEATQGYDLLGLLSSPFDLHIVTSKNAKLIERELLKERLKELEADIEAADASYQEAGK